MSEAPMGFEIVGGAGPEETAAILAVVAQLSAEEAAARSSPTQPPRQSTWVMAWRPRQSVTPLPSHSYDAMPWADVEPAEEVNP